MATINKQKAQDYFESLEGQALSAFEVNREAANLLKKFILGDGLELGETIPSS